MKTILINGSNDVGKDTFLEYVHHKYFCTCNQWSDKGKMIAETIGIKDNHTDKSRLAIAHIISAIDVYNMSLDYLIEAHAMNETNYHFITFRTPEQLIQLQKAFINTVTLKITRDVEVADNHADKKANKVICEYVIDNNSSLGDYFYAIDKFMNDING